jgi:3-oxoacyl-[acyl-carrier-protein] synthase II
MALIDWKASAVDAALRPRVVVTGVGVLTAAGIGLSGLAEALRDGRTRLRRLDDRDGLYGYVGGAVPGFDPTCFMPAKTARRLDRSAQLFLAASVLAQRDADLPPSSATWRSGVFEGTAVGGMEAIGRAARGSTAALPLVAQAMSGAGAAAVSAQIGFAGPSITFASGSVSSACALAAAFDQIRLGAVDVAMAGGGDAPLLPPLLDVFRRAGLLSPGDDAETACRPFDAARTGTALAEGAAALVLESLVHARERGARIYAEVAGVAQTSDAGHPLRPDESGVARAAAIVRAVEQSGRGREAIDHLVPHATGTRSNDRADARALEAAFGGAGARVPVSALKSILGHTLGACTAVETAAVLAAMEGGFVPPTAGLETIDPGCRLTLPRRASAPGARCALVASSALGGRNAALVVERWS